MSMRPDGEEVSKLRRAEQERLFKLPDDFPDKRPAEDVGVLLSDRIKYYCTHFKLIDPFDENDLLKPAGYDLTVGHNYSIRGEPNALTDGMILEIRPYQVAIIETYETLNLPPFLIARWNIRVKHAYQGLLWVGGAQVDPGFRGHLCCPIYNLSTDTVRLRFREPLAMIDFVTTTEYDQATCKKFGWRERRSVVFPEYPSPSSGIEEQVNQFQDTISKNRETTNQELSKTKAGLDDSLRDVRSRIDTFLTLIFAVVAVLFAGLGIVATRGPNLPSFANPPVWVATIALFFALRANRARDQEKQKWYSLFGPAIVAILVGTIAVGLTVLYAYFQGPAAPNLINQRIESLNTQIRDLRQESTALREELNRRNQGDRK